MAGSPPPGGGWPWAHLAPGSVMNNGAECPGPHEAASPCSTCDQRLWVCIRAGLAPACLRGQAVVAMAGLEVTTWAPSHLVHLLARWKPVPVLQREVVTSLMGQSIEHPFVAVLPCFPARLPHLQLTIVFEVCRILVQVIPCLESHLQSRSSSPERLYSCLQKPLLTSSRQPFILLPWASREHLDILLFFQIHFPCFLLMV